MYPKTRNQDRKTEREKERKSKGPRTVIILKSKCQPPGPTLQLHGATPAILHGFHVLMIDDGTALEGKPVEFDAFADVGEAGVFGISDH